jgi:hypothetical protein
VSGPDSTSLVSATVGAVSETPPVGVSGPVGTGAPIIAPVAPGSSDPGVLIGCGPSIAVVPASLPQPMASKIPIEGNILVMGGRYASPQLLQCEAPFLLARGVVVDHRNGKVPPLLKRRRLRRVAR